MAKYDEVAELTWENGQLSMHGLSGLLPTSHEKPIWNKSHDTLESIVQQYQNKNSNFTKEEHHAPTSAPTRTSSIAASTGDIPMVPKFTKKRSRSCSDYNDRNFRSNNDMVEECDIPNGCASASATFCRDNDTTMMTWASLESGRSFKTLEEDTACHYGSESKDDQDGRDTKGERQSNSTRRNRTAAIHNQSERRRRDRINQKMKALQKLVPNASKTDKASMLDEVINYLKQLQAKIQMMSMTSMPQMMMPLAMQQQQLQMSMLARMGAMGMGMMNINNMGTPRPFCQLGAPSTSPMFGAPSFMMPSMVQPHAPSPPKLEESASLGTNASIPLLNNPYGVTQPFNMDLLYNMAALYKQQMSQNNQAFNNLSQLHHK